MAVFLEFGKKVINYRGECLEVSEGNYMTLKNIYR